MDASIATLRRNSLDVAAARRRCLGYRRRILDISQQVGALHIAPAFSCTEITDVLYNNLMRREAERRVSRRVSDVEGSWLHDPIRHSGGAGRPFACGSRRLLQAERPSRRASRLRDAGHRRIHRLARPRARHGDRPGLRREAQEHRCADLLRAVRRRVPGRLDLGSHDDGGQSQARQSHRLHGLTTTSAVSSA